MKKENFETAKHLLSPLLPQRMTVEETQVHTCCDHDKQHALAQMVGPEMGERTKPSSALKRRWNWRSYSCEQELHMRRGPGDVWAYAAAKGHVCIWGLLQPGSLLMAMACVVTEGHGDVNGLGCSPH